MKFGGLNAVINFGMMNRKWKVGKVFERQRRELENERERNFQLEMELEFLRISSFVGIAFTFAVNF